MCTILSSSNIITRDKSKAVKKAVPRHLFLPTRMEYIRMQRHLRIMVLVVQKSSLYSTASRNNYRSPAFKNRFSSSRLSRPSPFFQTDSKLDWNSVAHLAQEREEREGEKKREGQENLSFLLESIFRIAGDKTFSRILIENANRWRNIFDSILLLDCLLLSYAFTRASFYS